MSSVIRLNKFLPGLVEGATTQTNQNSQLNTISRKAVTLLKNSEKVITEISNSQGIITKFWLAIYNINPGQVFIKIEIDGQLIFGNNLTVLSTDGMNSIALASDLLLTATQPCNYMTNTCGSNICTSTTLGGYLSIPMPFNNSVKISLINNTSSDGNYWSQVYFDKDTIPKTISLPQLHCTTFRYQTSYPNEYPLLSMRIPNKAIQLKGVRFHCIGQTGNWGEGRFRVYTGGSGMPNPISSMHWTDSQYTDVSPYQSNAKTIFTSSGTEDFFDSSWSLAGTTIPTTSDHSGILVNSAGSGNFFQSNTTISCYRFFGENGFSLPKSDVGEYLVFSWACGDPVAVDQGSTAIIGGHVFWYA